MLQQTGQRWLMGAVGLMAAVMAAGTTGCTATTPQPAQGDINISSVTSCVPNSSHNGYVAAVDVTNDGKRLTGTISMTVDGKKLKKTYPGFPGVDSKDSGRLSFTGIAVPKTGPVELVVKQESTPIARAQVAYSVNSEDPKLSTCALTQLTP